MSGLPKNQAECSVYPVVSGLINFKNHVFISKESTQILANEILAENWGNQNILLYKYLDYIWRYKFL